MLVHAFASPRARRYEVADKLRKLLRDRTHGISSISAWQVQPNTFRTPRALRCKAIEHARVERAFGRGEHRLVCSLLSLALGSRSSRSANEP